MKNDVLNKKFVNLSEIVSNEDLLEIKISTYSEWITNIVMNVKDDENILEIKLIDDFIENNLMLDDEIHCKIVVDDVVMVMKGKILDIGMFNSENVMIQISDIKKYSNERKRKRYRVNLCGRLVYNNYESSTFITIKNISNQGVSIVSKEPIESGEEVDIDIILWKKEVVSIEGKIVSMVKIDKNYKYGILITNMDNKSERLLDDFINELESRQIII